MAYSMLGGYAKPRPSKEQSFVMRSLFTLAAVGLLATLALPSEAGAMQRGRDQDAAFQARQQGQIMSLTTIRARIQVRGAEFIGAEFDSSALVYRLKFMRGGEVFWVDVDARTGRVLGRSN
jgi:uncharacterized membrane protein YkoI